MSKISLSAFIFCFIFVFSIPLYVTDVNADSTKGTEGICSEKGVNDRGVTKGLYGLCVAYCEAGANSERVLENYNRKKKASDPDMPCLEVTPPTLNCACWNTLTAEQIGAGLSPDSCDLDPSADSLSYANDFGDSEVLFATDGACFRSTYNASTGTYLFWPGPVPMDGEQSDECRAEILALAQSDFEGFDCLTSD